jgi:hypothetical protein
MLSGSVAMSVYVVPRATRDFDFVIFLQEGDVQPFVESFKDGFYCDIDSIKDAILHKSLFNIIDFESGYKADFVILKDSAFRQEEFNRRITVSFMDKLVDIVSVEDLLLSKLIWIQEIQSAIQMEDIKQLWSSESLDKYYVNKWITQMNLQTFNLI